MREIEPPFEIDYQGGTAKVIEAEISNRRIFHIQREHEKKALTITIGHGRKDEKFWTSIPEGRQAEAEEVGRLIAAHIRNKKR